jgi:hypothetical protein
MVEGADAVAVFRARHVAPRTALGHLGPHRSGRDLGVFREAIETLYADGWAQADVDWCESIEAPSCPDEFGREICYVICNSGMRFTVARGIFDRCMAAKAKGLSASTAFGHKGKAGAIDHVWENRHALLAGYLAAEDKLAYCEGIPWIGGITKYHLAKNFGLDVAKPDVHLVRLANLHGDTAQGLCETIASVTGWRVATVDTLLWRACSTGVLCGHTGRILRGPTYHEAA